MFELDFLPEPFDRDAAAGGQGGAWPLPGAIAAWTPAGAAVEAGESDLANGLDAASPSRGFAGSFDPYGDAADLAAQTGADALELANDRDAARDELRDRFVVGDRPGADASGQVVTEEEFEQIVQLYSDVRLGRTELQLDFSGVQSDELSAEENAAEEAQARALMMTDLASQLQQLDPHRRQRRSEVGVPVREPQRSLRDLLVRGHDLQHDHLDAQVTAGRSGAGDRPAAVNGG